MGAGMVWGRGSRGATGRRAGLALVAALLTGCVQAQTVNMVAPELVLASEITNQAPKSIPGICWASQSRPAVIETVTEQIEVAPEVTNADGTVTPATYRSESRQRILGDGEMEYFRTPCEDVFSSYFITTLQRALAVRGLYKGAPSGEIDRETTSAIRNWQRPRGLDSATLSLKSAKILGLLRWETQ